MLDNTFNIINKRVYHSLTALLLILLVSTPSAFAQVTAQVDRQLLSEDETLTLIIRAEGQDRSNQPDVTPLNQDFDVLGTSQSSQIQIGNGQSSSSTQWQITLMPKHTGDIVIPALSVGNNTTDEIAVKVVSASQPQGNQTSATDKPIFVEASVDKTNPYVQEQVILTVRLYHRVQIRSGSLSQPDIKNAFIEKLGDDVNTREQKNGELYDIIERRYALFPQQSGDIEIPPMTFEGAVPDTRRGQRNNSPFGNGVFSDPFDMLQPTQTVRSRTQALKLNVKTIPSDYTGKHWLPARSLQLKEQWSADSPTFSVGQPVTRTISIAAEGLTAAQLPSLDMPSLDKVNIYPDQSKQENRTNARGIVGVLQQKLAILPNEAGKIVLPEISIPWWNTQTQRYEVATLPAKEITVTGGNNAAPPAPATTTPLAPATPTPQPTETTPDTAAPVLAAQANYWPWISGTLATLWLITLYLWQRERRRTRSADKQPMTTVTPKIDHKRYQQDIVRHAQANEAHATCNALVQWAQAYWPAVAIRTLGDIQQRCPNTDFATELQKLDTALYTQTSAWQGSEMAIVFDAWVTDTTFQEKSQNHKDKLPNLYS